VTRPRSRLVVLVPREREVPPAADVAEESRLRADLREGQVVVPSWSDGRWHSVHVDGEPAIGVQLAQDLDAPEGFRACADPSGHPFRTTWGEQA